MGSSATSHYRVAWQWFAGRAGQVVPWAEIAAAPVRLTSLPKGIYKPGGIGNPALSVKQTLSSRYRDMEPARLGGTWVYQYHQEDPDVSFWTNRSLVEAMELRWPVGVLRQVSMKPSPNYEVLGLAWVVQWRLNYFVLQGLTAAESREVTLADVPRQQDRGLLTEAVYDPSDVGNQRVVRMVPTIVREGQPEFRRQLLRLYDGRCCMTGYDAGTALQAAHISGYSGPPSNVAANGLLLRADLHLLFDAGMLAVSGDTYQLQLSDELKSTRYGELQGRSLSLPASRTEWPNAQALEFHRQAAGL